MAGCRLTGKGVIVLIVVVVCIGSLFPTPAHAKVKRGDAPQCQVECLGEHVRRMKEFSDGLVGNGHKMEYQDKVQDEASRYLDCLTNCREVLPVK